MKRKQKKKQRLSVRHEAMSKALTITRDSHVVVVVVVAAAELVVNC